MNTATLSNITVVTVDINTAALINAIQAADLSRGHDSALPMLTAYRVELQDNTLQFITTDRYRLSVVSVDIADTAAASLAASGLFNDGGLTIDGGGMYAIGKIKTKANTLGVSFSARGISANYDGGTLTAPAVDAQFPKWRTLITIDAEHLSSTGNYTPQYLADAAKACKIIGGKTPLQLTLRGLKPALLHTAKDGISLEIILMPCRTA
jgi:DNA polymerase III sliding clamp (beta) subunit (PCNA family)